MIKRVTQSYKKHIGGLILGPSIKILEAVFDLLIPLFMKAIIDLNQYGDPSLIPNSISSPLAHFIRVFGQWFSDQRLSDAVIGGVIILVMSVIGFIVTMVSQFIAASLSVKVGSEVRLSLYEKILRFSKKDKEEFTNARLQTILNSDVYQVERGVLLFARLSVRAPFIIIGSIIFCFILDWRIGLAFTFIVPLVFISLFAVLRKSSKNYVTIQKGLDNISNKTGDTIEGARVVRAFASQEYENEEFSGYNDYYHKESLRVHKNNALMNPIVFEITSLITILIIVFLSPVLFSGDSDASTRVILISTLIAAMAYLAQIFFATIQLSSVMIDFTKARVARRRIDEVLEKEISITNNPEGKTADISSGEELLRFDNVGFTYNELEEGYVLSNISFSLNKGNSLGIIGGTGSGKSSIVNLIERFIEPTVGEIYYKDIPLKEYDLPSLRNDIGLVNQKSFLFNGTIKDNFLMANPFASDEEIDEALKQAEAYDFVYQNDKNINRVIKEGGSNVSGGQRQRLCIARALIKNPELLILDDSMSALDLLTDKKIRERLRQNKNMSKIIVSQRVASVSDCDAILVIDEGKVVGMGKHEELLKTCDIYKEIVNSQLTKE